MVVRQINVIHAVRPVLTNPVVHVVAPEHQRQKQLLHQRHRGHDVLVRVAVQEERVVRQSVVPLGDVREVSRRVVAAHVVLDVEDVDAVVQQLAQPLQHAHILLRHLLAQTLPVQEHAHVVQRRLAMPRVPRRLHFTPAVFACTSRQLRAHAAPLPRHAAEQGERVRREHVVQKPGQVFPAEAQREVHRGEPHAAALRQLRFQLPRFRVDEGRAMLLQHARGDVQCSVEHRVDPVHRLRQPPLLQLLTVHLAVLPLQQQLVQVPVVDSPRVRWRVVHALHHLHEQRRKQQRRTLAERQAAPLSLRRLVVQSVEVHGRLVRQRRGCSLLLPQQHAQVRHQAPFHVPLLQIN